MVVMSPFAKPGYISHTYTDHVSLLSSIERNRRLGPLSGRQPRQPARPASSRADPYVPTNRPAIGDVMDYFDFRHAEVSVARPHVRNVVLRHVRPAFVPSLQR